MLRQRKEPTPDRHILAVHSQLVAGHPTCVIAPPVLL